MHTFIWRLFIKGVGNYFLNVPQKTLNTFLFLERASFRENLALKKVVVAMCWNRL